MKAINTIFTSFTIDEFNKIYRTELSETMNIEELSDYLEENELNYLYCSYNPDDVMMQYREFYAETEHQCNLVCINEIFLALY